VLSQLDRQCPHLIEQVSLIPIAEMLVGPNTQEADRELAQRVRDAGAKLHAAIVEAQAAGLTVGLSTRSVTVAAFAPRETVPLDIKVERVERTEY
jgi:hypothetical protein